MQWNKNAPLLLGSDIPLRIFDLCMIPSTATLYHKFINTQTKHSTKIIATEKPHNTKEFRMAKFCLYNLLLLMTSIERSAFGVRLHYHHSKHKRSLQEVPEPVTIGGHTRRVLGVAYNPTSPTEIASASDDLTVRIWNATSGTLLRSFDASIVEVHDSGIEDVHYSPDGTRIVSSGKSTASDVPTIAVWDAAATSEGSGPLLTFSSGDIAVAMASFSPQGTYIVSASYDVTQVWDASSGESKMVLPGSQRAIFSPDGTKICTCDWAGNIKVWNADFSNNEDTSRQQASPLLTIYAAHVNEPYVWGLAYNPNGTLIASGSANYGISGTVDVWDAETGERVVDPLSGEHTAGVVSLSFRPDGRFIVSGAEDWTLKIWDIEVEENGEPLVATLNGHAGIVRGVAFGPNGNSIVSGSDDTTVKVWDVSTILPPLPEGLDPPSLGIPQGETNGSHSKPTDESIEPTIEGQSSGGIAVGTLLSFLFTAIGFTNLLLVGRR